MMFCRYRRRLVLELGTKSPMHAEQQASEKGSAATQIKLCNGGMQAVKRICHTCYKAILAPFSFLVQQPSSTKPHDLETVAVS